MKSKVLKVFIIMVIIALAFGIKSYAADGYSCKVSLLPDKTSIKPGEAITYDLKVSDINAGEGVVISDFYVSYNTEIFDCKVKSADEDKWVMNGFLDGKVTMSTYGVQPTKEDQTIAKIILTAKTGVSNNSYQVDLTEISFITSDDQKIEIPNIQTNVKVGESSNNNNYTCDFSVSQNKSTVKPGESVEYDLKLSNINAGNGIVLSDFFIEYDSNNFDCKVISYDETKWTINAALNGKYTLSTYGLQPTKESQVFAKAILTAKTNASNNTYQVNFKNVSFTTDENDNKNIPVAGKNTTIIVQQSQSNNNSNTPNNIVQPTETNNNSNGQTNNQTTNQLNNNSNGQTINNDSNSQNNNNTSGKEQSVKTNTNTEKNNTKKKSTKNNNKKSLPYSGTAGTVGIVLGFITLSASAIGLYLRYRYLNIL